ncbi:MAG: DPP IV N-terminal domain-containing protein, partial [Actinomycetota bacterium]|nr:DPP IV N-terminal domain-containing protein [Actinomycetota bacterium]
SSRSCLARRRSVAVALGLAGSVALGLGVTPAQASFPGANGKISCSGGLTLTDQPTITRDQSRLEIFSINSDGTGETQLTDNTDSDYLPRYSADGTKIAFVREAPNNTPVQIWTMNADGSNQVGPLTSEGSNSFVGDWSPDGTQIVFHSNRDGNFEIYKMNADGSDEVNLTDNAATGANRDMYPTWSPDGRKIAFTSNRDGNNNTHVMDVDGTNVENLTGSSLAEESGPRWSPDGERIAFYSDRDAFPRPDVARNFEIYTMKLDGSDVTRLTFTDFDASDPMPGFDITGWDIFPAWSPDGTRIVFHSGRAKEFRDTGFSGGVKGQYEIYHVDAVRGEGPGGGPPVRLTNRPFNDQFCDWQPLALPVPPPPLPAPPSPPPPPALTPLEIFPAKLEVERARVERGDRQLNVLAPVTARASGEVDVEFFADQQRFEFTEDIDAENRRIRFQQAIPRGQAELGTGIMTITFPGDDDTRPQEVRLRAASQPADLELDRPVIENGRIKARGTISDRARGVVRLQVQYVVDGETKTLALRGEIDDGEWEIDQALSDEVQAEIARRTGTMHSYTLFTGYFERRIRGEMQSYEVLGSL